MYLPVTAALAILAFAGPALAGEGAGGVYKCTDEKGAVTYSTSPCKGAKHEFLSREKLEGKITTIEFPKPAVAPPPEAAVAEPVPATSASRAGTPPLENAAASAPAPTQPANPQIRKLPVGGGQDRKSK